MSLVLARRIVSISWALKTMTVIFFLCTKIAKMSGYVKRFYELKYEDKIWCLYII